MAIDDAKVQTEDEEYIFPSLELAYNLTKEHLPVQMDKVHALDTKANFVLGSAAALISAALILESALLTIYHSVTGKPLQAVLLFILLVTFIAVMLAAILAYKVKDFYEVPDPMALYKYYLSKSESFTKAKLFRAMVEAHDYNDKLIKKKVFWINISFIGLSCEVVLLILFLLVAGIF